MGLWHPERPRAKRPVGRTIALAGFVVLAFVLSGCSKDTQAGRFGMPEIVTEQGQANVDLWRGAWIAALVTGVIVWGLIIGVCVYYRRRSDDEVPIQTRYNLPVEIFYTVFPIIMVLVFFSHTVRVQNEMIELDENPDVCITVVGEKWTWTFNHHAEATPGCEGEGEVGYIVGDMVSDPMPTLVLPVGQTIHFDLRSPDVIHDFGIPAFSMRMDVVPGRDNAFQVTPTEVGGPYAGKCYELCGSYHSRMLFQVEIVSQEEYEAYVAGLLDNPETRSDHPVIGGSYADSPYLNPETEGGHE